MTKGAKNNQNLNNIFCAGCLKDTGSPLLYDLKDP